MKKKFYFLSLLLSGVFILGVLNIKGQAVDDPNLDRIPDDFLQQQAANKNPMASTVITVDGYDNFYLGVDFAEGHISESPVSPGKYFTAFNINDTHYTLDGHDWSDVYVSFPGYSPQGDPCTAYDGSGVLYYETMYGGIQGCVVVKSTDNGQTWSSPVVAISGNDKNWMTADMTDGPNADNVYTVMTNSGSGNFARSTNQGASFQNTATFNTQSLPGMMVCVGPWGATDGGAVYVVTNSGGSFSSNYTFYQSLNGGTSFTYMSQQGFSGYVGTDVNGRNSVQNMRTRPYPFITADNSNGTYRGRLYVVYASNSPAGNGNKPDIFCRYSDDGGSTWSSAVTVNDDFPSVNNSQWHPAIWCDYETGRLYVQWMDTRDTPAGDYALIYASYSDDGGQTFVQNHAVSNVKMKINCTSCGGGGTPRYQGDYNAIVSNQVTSMATWADFRNGTFASFTGYFPDYAMTVSPETAPTSGNIATLNAEVPSVKAYDNDVVFSIVVETPSAGSFSVNYPSGNTLSTFPGSIPIEVISDGDVPVGFYDVTITGTGPNGTPIHIREATVEVVPLAPPTAGFGSLNTTVCAGGAVDFSDQSTGNPASWLWTFDGGDPATSTDQNPAGVIYDTPGSYDVKLVVSNSAGSDSLTQTAYVEALALPAAPSSSNEAVCFGEVVPDLTATGTAIQWYDDSLLTNMVYSGNTFGTGQTNTGVYTYYATQTDGGCESLSTMVTLTINELPTVGLAAFTGVCVDMPAYVLTGGTPAGGTYSGPGVTSDSIFDPAIAGAGTHLITYTYMDAETCTNDTTQELMVYALPVVSFDPIDDVCVNGEMVTLAGGMPDGGIYSGTAVDNGVFDPVAAGIGEHVITYFYEDTNGCTSTADQSITVNDFPHPFAGEDTTICSDQSIMLDATTAGVVSYEWYPGGETTAQITVDSTGVGVGSQMYVVSVMDDNTCISSDSVTIEFKDCTRIGELSGVSNIKLYPNPGQGEFSIQIDTDVPMELNIRVYNNRGISVYEELGRRIADSEVVHMDLNTQPSGIYLVTIYNNQGKWVDKLVIRK